MKNRSQFAGALKDYLVRNRVKIFDLGFIIITLAVLALFAFQIDIFENEARETRHQETVELDELMVLTSLLMGGVLFYTWRRAREHQRENRQRIAAEREVMSLALQDPLTGLPNRRQFDDTLKAAVNAMPAEPEAHAVFLLDLNGFKRINDVHGHPIGDQVLIHVGARLLRAVRDGDLAARLGGDEFAVLARNVAGAEGATNIALRIIESLTPPVVINGVQHAVGTAIGVALTPHDGDTPAELLRKADVALYRAKSERRSTVRFFEAEMDARLQERDALERALLADVERDAFVLRFQPTRAGDGRIASFEAMARWPHPTLGDLEPDRFLPIAEERGVLGRLTEQLLRKACEAAATWPADVRLSFNLPGALLTEPAFGLRVISALAEAGLSPNRLNLEIDEGMLIRHTEAAQALLTPLRQAGVSVVADHFGTGYSDLQNLHRLKLDGIKIDHSFIAAMTHDRQASVLVKALIGIAQGLDLAVAADGVGGEDQKLALAALGCDQGQGALHGDPVSLDDARAMVTMASPAARRAR